VILVCVFSWAQRENFTWGFQSPWFMVFLLGLCAFHAQEISKEFSDAGNTKKSYLWQAAAVGSAALAAMSVANGVLVSLMLIVQATYLRFAPRRIGLLVLCATLIWGGYFTDLFIRGQNPLVDTLRENYIHLLVYVLLYLGSPIYHAGFGKWLAAGFGALVLMGVAYSVFIAFRREKRPQAISLLVMSLFVVASALITASGRIVLGVDQALSPRYATPALLLLCSISFFLWINTSGSLRRWIGLGAFFAVLAIMLCQRSAFVPEREQQYRKLLAGLALRSHVYDADYTDVLYPVPIRLRDVAWRAEAMQISIFAPDQPDYEALPSHVSAERKCLGAIDKIMPTTTTDMLAAQGWAFDPEAHEYVSTVVFADAVGVVLGSGLTGERRPDLMGATGSKDAFGGWIGFFRKPPTQSVRVFGKTGAGYCVLPEDARIPLFAPDQPEHVSAERQCVGAIEKIIPTTTADMLAARGWAFDPATREYVRAVVFADADGVVIGSGLTGELRSDLREKTGLDDPFGGWIGFFRKPPTQNVRVFGKTGADYCVLPEDARIPD